MYSSLSQSNDLPQHNGFVEMGDKALAPTVTLPGTLRAPVSYGDQEFSVTISTTGS